MFIELHLLQNFAPSCLNRDDTNSPKDCVFGGARRARISSQCIKRAIRTRAMTSESLAGLAGVRTKRLHDVLARNLVKAGKSEDQAAAAAEQAVELMDLKLTEKGTDRLTEYLLFMGKSEIQCLTDAVLKHWEPLAKALEAGKAEKKKDEKKGKKDKKDKKDVPKDLQAALDAVLDGHSAADIAMFGRMLANLPEKNVDAACQVAHALSTHKVDMEMDFYTAVDDLKPDDTSGADMMGTVEFNSACFYRYAVIQVEKLLENLGDDSELAEKTIEAFLTAAIEAIPTGKQNTFAAHNPPSLIFAVVRENGVPWSMANAFETPVRTNGNGILGESTSRLAKYWGNLTRVYGGKPCVAVHVSLEESEGLNGLGSGVENAAELVKAVMTAVRGDLK